MSAGTGAARGRPGLLVSVRWSAVGIAVSGLTRFVYSALVGHLAGTAALGVVNSGLFLALLAVQAGPNAAGAAAAKFLAHAAGRAERAGVSPDLARVWRQVLAWGIALSMVCAVAAGVATVAVLERDVVQGALVAVLVAAMGAYLLTRGARFAAGDFAATAWAEAAAAAVSLALLLLVLVAGDLSWALAPLAAGYALYAALMWPRHGALRSRPTRDAARGGYRGPALQDASSAAPVELRSFLAWAVLGGLASAGLLQVSVVVAGAVDDPLRVGQYAAAVAVSTPMALLAAPLFQVLFSHLSRSTGSADAAAVRAGTDAATRALVVVMVAVGGGLALVARTAVGVMGADLGAAVPLVHVVALSVLVSTLSVPAVASLTSGGGIRAVALTSATGLALGVAVMALTAPSWGLGAGVEGVAAGYAVGTVATNVALWRRAWRRHHLPWGRLSVKIALALGALVALLALPWAATITGGWVLGIAFAAGWLALNTGQVKSLVRLRAGGPG